MDNELHDDSHSDFCSDLHNDQHNWHTMNFDIDDEVLNDIS